MISVRPFEADILRVLHAVFGRTPVEPVLEILLRKRPRPKCLGGNALSLIEGTLARGCVRKLARLDGWRHRRFVQGDRVVEGRLWERTPPEWLKLRFSEETLAFLIHLVADDPIRWPVNPCFTANPPTLGDSLLLLYTLATFRDTKVAGFLGNMPAYRSNELCRLAFPHDFAEVSDFEEPKFGNWVEPPRSWLLETLQGWLAEHWIAAERRKRKLAEPALVVKFGQEQSRVTDAYFAALEASGRRDLARFLLLVARELLRDGRGLDAWNGAVRLQGLNLAGRAEANRAALAAVAPLDRLQRWEREARDVGFFDDSYPAARLWKSDWEMAGGEDLCDRARLLFRSADPLAPGP